jgi:hypothetical protein
MKRYAPPGRLERVLFNSALVRQIEGSLAFTRPTFPGPVTPGWDRGSWAFAPNFTPRRYWRRMSGWGQAMGTCLGYVTISWSSDLHNRSLRATSCRTIDFCVADLPIMT